MYTKPVHAPHIQPDGTGKAQLLGAYEAALDALQAACFAVHATAPNGRDYPTSSALETAQAEHVWRVMQINTLRDEIDALCGAIDTGRTSTTVHVHQ